MADSISRQTIVTISGKHKMIEFNVGKELLLGNIKLRRQLKK